MGCGGAVPEMSAPLPGSRRCPRDENGARPRRLQHAPHSGQLVHFQALTEGRFRAFGGRLFCRFSDSLDRKRAIDRQCAIGKRDFNTGFVQRRLDGSDDLVAAGADIHGGGAGPPRDLEIDGTGAERFGKNLYVTDVIAHHVDLTHGLRDHVPGFVDIFSICDANHDRRSAVGFVRPHRDRVVEKLGIGHDDKLPVGLTYMRVADGDCLDFPFGAVAFDVVVNAERLAQQDQNTSEEVFERVLEGKPDRDGPEAEGRQSAARCDRWEDDGERDQQSRKPDHRAKKKPKNIDQVAAQTGAAPDPRDKELQTPYQTCGQQKDGDGNTKAGQGGNACVDPARQLLDQWGRYVVRQGVFDLLHRCLTTDMPEGSQSRERFSPWGVCSMTHSGGPMPDTESHDLTERAEERTAVEEAATLSPRLIFEAIRRNGEEELERPNRALWFSGIAAGILISFSVLGEALLRSKLPDAEWRYIVENLGYTFGFLLVILGRMQLFTENTITTVVPVLIDRSLETVGRLATLWGIVLVANVIGAFAVAIFLAQAPVLGPDIFQAMTDLSHHATGMPAWEGFARGIPAGVLIAALVWMLPTAKGSEVLLIVLFTWLIALGDFTHIVAGSVEMAFLMVQGDLGLGQALFGFFGPVLLGNVVGGTAIFTMLTWAQIQPEVEEMQ